MGVARLGAFLNFISHAVILGFTAGAAVLIAFKQLPNLIGLGRSPERPHELAIALIASAMGHLTRPPYRYRLVCSRSRSFCR